MADKETRTKKAAEAAAALPKVREAENNLGVASLKLDEVIFERAKSDKSAEAGGRSAQESGTVDDMIGVVKQLIGLVGG